MLVEREQKGFVMARLARVVAADVPHHVTRRGNARRFILDCDADRRVYLDLLREHIKGCRVSLIGYCLMSNHVHLVLIPREPKALARALRHAHGRYASYWNAAYRSSGHVWQERYYSCPLDEAHLWEALRYTELNPVRAGLVTDAESWEWSSATVHCGGMPSDALLDLAPWRLCWSGGTWRKYLKAGEIESDRTAIRRSTYTGRPLGAAEFIEDLEQKMRRRLALQKGGRPRKLGEDTRQGELRFSE
jgi:putative transposase